MPWTTPKTWADNELVSAALMNEQMRDNMNVLIEAVVPTGALVPYAGSSAPVGWLLCDGAAISRTIYAALYTILGTVYGAGDGSTTFNLPDLRGRIPLGKDNMGGASANRVTATAADNLGQGSGAETHTLSTTEMPAHAHTIRAEGYGSPNSSSASGTRLHMNGWGTSFDNDANWTQNYQWGSPVSTEGGGGAHNNMPPYITLNYLIKT